MLLHLGRYYITGRLLQLDLLQGQDAPERVNRFGKISIFWFFELRVSIA